MSTVPVVGIDLGTTNSAIGVLDGERVRFLPNALGEVLTPSAVARDPKTGLVVVGRTAKDLIAANPHLGTSRFKTEMGLPNTRKVGDRTMSIVELSAYVLDSLRADAERELATRVDRCVVTVPAYFDEAQRHATRQAAEQAGFVVERILNEPTAAAIAYGLHRRDAETQFAVVDLGGGTFDVCVMELFEGVLQVKSVAGESRLGGEDFTDAVAELLAARAGVPCPARGTAAWALLFKRAELAKRALARWPRTEVTLSADVAGRAMTLEIAADEVDRAWEPLVARLHGPVKSAVKHAGIDRAELAEVVLVGGATRMPCVRRAIAELFGREPLCHGDPDLLVAEGAAIQAAMVDGAGAVGDLVVTDVASHSLGVSTSRHVGSRLVDGYFSPVIHRNTVIPTSQWNVYSTLHDDQQWLDLGIYEGEGRRVEDNRRIGALRVFGIPRGPAPKDVKVRFTYDHNGMLEVEAEVVETKKVVSVVFQRTGGEVTGDALDAARGRLRAIRSDPADRPRYRDVMARAKLLWAEGDARVRQRIDLLATAFESALAGRAPADIDRAYQALLACCKELDRDERW